MNTTVSISIVSHGQSQLALGLLEDLWCINNLDLEILLTINIPEDLPAVQRGYKLKVVRNKVPLGFGANHNQAFAHSTGRYFAVLNPDLRLKTFDMGSLISEVNKAPNSVVAPKVVGPDGRAEDSARKFPTPLGVFSRFLGRSKRIDYEITEDVIDVDWVAGMFMMFPRDVFRRVGGFDERYFMYYEDVDICRRLKRIGGRVCVCPSSVVIHDARRASHKNLRHLGWHSRSVLRYFTHL